jgi:ribosomal protein S12 methylthiotransferase
MPSTMIIGSRCLSGRAAQRRRQNSSRGRPGQRQSRWNDTTGNEGKDQNNKIMFQSLGCPRNFVDTEVMLGTVLHAGMEYTQETHDADYLVLNTCGFLQSARDESKSAIQDLLDQKKKGSKLIVTGCMVNLHKDQILHDYPQVDHVLGSGAVDKILTVIQGMKQQQQHPDNDNQEEKGQSTMMTLGEQRKSFLERGDTPRFLATPPHYAYLKISEGCRKRCAFCIIPKIKGPLQSKPVDQIVTEFQALLQYGSKEIILIAQDLGDYGKDLSSLSLSSSSSNNVSPPDEDREVGSHRRTMKKNGLVTLLKAILDATPKSKEKSTDDFWLRLLYLYPDEITPELVDVMADDHRICRYLDMPIQHINNDVLKKMKRTTTGEDIKHTIHMLRDRLDGIHIRTSLMVGFPGETEEQFQELVDFVQEYQLDNVGAFMYSNEELAWSSRLPDHVSEDVKLDRYDRLMRAQLEVTRQRNQTRIEAKERFQVVVEGMHPDHEDLIVGRYYGQCPDIDGQIIINDVDELGKLPNPGQRYWVELTDYDNYDLIGRIVKEK